MVEPLPMKDTSGTIMHQWDNAVTGTNLISPSSSNSPIDVNVHGDITLKSEKGQTFDISREIEKDPLFIRTITQLITQNISKTNNGGKGIMSLQRH